MAAMKRAALQTMRLNIQQVSTDRCSAANERRHSHLQKLQKKFTARAEVFQATRAAQDNEAVARGEKAAKRCSEVEMRRLHLLKIRATKAKTSGFRRASADWLILKGAQQEGQVPIVQEQPAPTSILNVEKEMKREKPPTLMKMVMQQLLSFVPAVPLVDF